ncbi:MAG: L-histidine N(alpha)-methyltransferase [Nitriliruptoraceae bacterium]
MSGVLSTERVSLTRLTPPRPLREALAADVRRGLTGPRKWLPPIYFYDARGSELFERITELEEYYPTRVERGILARHADDLVAAIAPCELLELGSGSSAKTDLLLAALQRSGGRRYAALEISEAALVGAIERLETRHPWLSIDGYVGDFHHDLPAIERLGPRLIAFLGSTLGNLAPAEREVLLSSVADVLAPDDGLLLGVDLVKSASELVPAYDDALGVTAAFNRNVLEVINRELDGDLPVESFAHRAVWNRAAERIEMHLVATTTVRARLAAIDLDLEFRSGEHIVTEHSHKFRIEQLRRELLLVGLRVSQVVTDDRDRFAVVLARPA